MAETRSFDRCSPAERTTKRELTTDVVYTVADVSDTDPVDLPPLYDVIDTDALNDLVAGSYDSALRTISFQYCGYTVTVTGDGDISVASTA